MSVGLAIILLAAPLASGPAAAAPLVSAAAAVSQVADVSQVAAGPARVSLGAASSYSVLGASTVTNTGLTVVGGDLGVSPGTAVTGFPPGVITANSGAFHSADSSAAAAQSAAQAAYTDAQGRTPTAQYKPVYDIGSSTFAPGVYAFPSSIGITGTVTLDGGGDPNSVFIFQAGSTLVAATYSTVVLTNGAQADNVFWQVGSSATLNTGATFAGTIVAQASVSLSAGVSVEGRTLALVGAVTMISDNFTTAPAITTAPTISITSPAITNSRSPKIIGISDAALSTLILVSVGTQQLIAHVGLLGYWTVTPSGLSDAAYPVHASVSDSVANVGSADQSLLVDTVAPALAITAQAASNSPTPVISGTTDAAAGSMVRVVVASQTLSSVVSATGTWTVAPTTMADGVHPITASVSDEAANVATAAGSVTTDTIDPVLSVTSSDESQVASPTLSGTTDAPAGSTVFVTVDGVVNGATVTAAGTWSVVWASLGEGNHPVSISTTDEAGNTGFSTQTLNVDTIAPKVIITTSDISNSAAPAIAGTSDNPTVTVTVGGHAYTAVTAADGTWSIIPGHLPDQQYLVIATVADEAGNLGVAQQNLTVDTVAPAVAITSLPLTRSSTPIISGTADGIAGTVVTLAIDGNIITTVLTVDNTWSLGAPGLTDGTHVLALTVADPAGNIGTARQTLTIDTTVPLITITSATLTNQANPTITGWSDAPTGTAVVVNFNGHSLPATVATDGTWHVVSGTVTDDTYPVTATVYDLAGNRGTATSQLEIDTVAPVVTITSSALSPTGTPTVSGTTSAPQGTVVTVVIDSRRLSSTVGSDGKWTATPTMLLDGTHTITVSATDAAGNVGIATQSLLTDTVLPVIAITSPDHTRDSTPGISGTTDEPAGTIITVTVGDSITLTARSTSALTWTVSPGSLPDGVYAVHSSVSDAVGNVGQNDQILTLDTVAPTVQIASAVVTNDTTPTLSGITDADPGTPVVVTVGGQTLTTAASATTPRAWSVTATTLAQGTYPVVVTVTDLSGNTRTALQNLRIDTTDPAIAVTSPPTTTVSTPIIFGTADGAEGTTVSVSVDGTDLSTLLDASGNWSLPAGRLSEGSHPVVATVFDAAGNTGTASQSLVVDTVVVPTAPIIPVTPAAATTLFITSADLTRDPTPSISGTSDAPTDSVVTVQVAGQTLTTKVRSTGSWSVTASALDDGGHNVTASVLVAGVTGSDTQTLTVDTTAPSVSITSGNLSNTSDAPITGTSNADPGTAITVAVDGQILSTNLSQANTWTVTPLTLGDGPHQVTVTVSDPAGNTSTASESLTVDTIPPSITITSAAKTNDPTPTITGQTDAAPGTSLTVTIGVLVFPATVTRDNGWSVVSSHLADGDHDVSAVVSDLAGNSGVANQVLAIDTTPPDIDITSQPLTDDSTPTISGTSSAAQGSIVTVIVDAHRIQTAVSSSGTWSVDPGPLVDADYPVTASASDAAGNIGRASQTLTVDTIPPAITISSFPTSAIVKPTITGFTDAVPFSTVAVAVDGILTTTQVGWAGTWSIVTGVLTNGAHSVVASTTDAAGNTGVVRETLTVRVPMAISLPSAVVGGIPVITITSAPLLSSANPTISGTTTAPVGRRVTVMVDAVMMVTTVLPDSTWTIVAAHLDDGTHSISAVTSNASGASVAALQVLTVDTTAPALSITSPALSNQSVPVIEGSTDAVAGSVVTVLFDTTTLTAIVGSDARWSVTAPTSPDGDHGITATVADALGNVAVAELTLLIDTSDPVIRIDSNALTNQPSPEITGTTDVGAGVTVTVTIDGTSHVTTTGSTGNWSFTAGALADGDHQVSALVSDLAGNNGRTTEVLVVDTVAPLIGFTSSPLSGGSTPTLAGTSTASEGSTVTVTIGSQILTASVLADGAWSAEPALLPDANYAVAATVSDPAGNLAESDETLSVNTVTPLISVGRAVTVDGSTPALHGTSDAPFGSTIMIMVNGQTLLTTVVAPAAVSSLRTFALRTAIQPVTGTWTVYPATATLGIYPVQASVSNLYGNVGRSAGTMTISIVPLPTLAFVPPPPAAAGPTPAEVILAMTGGTNAIGGWGVVLVVLGALLLLVRRRWLTQ